MLIAASIFNSETLVVRDPDHHSVWGSFSQRGITAFDHSIGRSSLLITRFGRVESYVSFRYAKAYIDCALIEIEEDRDKCGAAGT
jgi:hypothetical protein